MLTRDEVERLEKLTAVAGSRWYYSNADDECVSALPAALATIRELVEGLRRIATEHQSYDDSGGGSYGIGVTDGHRCAANIARDLLAAWDGGK